MEYQSSLLTRRRFLWQASVAGLTIPLLQPLLLTGCASQADSAAPVETKLSWKVVVVSDQEPGEPLIVTGTVFAPDSQTPVEGARLHIHQTDATGHYTTRGGENRNTRINGWMQTGKDGRYEFRTIKPAAYPGGTNPAHIHVYLSAPGYPEYWTDDFLFDDDTLVTARMRERDSGKGTFSHILKLERGSDGVLRGRRDFRLERCARNCTGN